MKKKQRRDGKVPHYLAVGIGAAWDMERIPTTMGVSTYTRKSVRIFKDNSSLAARLPITCFRVLKNTYLVRPVPSVAFER